MPNLENKYYCNKCNRYHYKNKGTIYFKHLDSANTGKKKINRETTKKTNLLFKKEELFSRKAKRRYNEIASHYKYDKSRLEFGFGISKQGEISKLIIGTHNDVNAGGKSFRIFGNDLKYVIHSHPDLNYANQPTLSKIFSLDDLIGSNTYDFIPVLMFRNFKEIKKENKRGQHYFIGKDTYYLKVGINIPKNRMKIINEYGKLYKRFKRQTKPIIEKGSPFLLNKKEEKKYNKIIKRFLNLIKTIEREYDIRTYYLFKERNIQNSDKIIDGRYFEYYESVSAYDSEEIDQIKKRLKETHYIRAYKNKNVPFMYRFSIYVKKK